MSKLRLIFIESFVPVMMVVCLIAITLVYANYKAIIASEQIVVINIPAIEHTPDVELTSNFGSAIIGDEYNNEIVDPMVEKAYQLIENKKWVAAETLLKKILNTNKSSKAYNDLGALYLRQNRLDDAMAQYELALQQKPVYLNTYVNRGLVKSKRGQYKEAISDYSIVLDQIPYHFQANLNIGVAYIKLKKYKKAVEKLKTASELAGGARKAKALYNLGIAYRNLGPGKYKRAHKVFANAIRIRPDYIEARFAQASLEPNTPEGRKRALQQYAKVLDLHPEYPPAYFRIAMVHSDANELKQAQDAYLTAIRIDPAYSKARFNLASLYIKTKNWQAAKDHFEQLLTDDDIDNARLHFQLGRVAYGQKNYGQALLEYDTALKIKKGKYPKALLNQGLVYNKIGKFDLAIESYEKAINLKKDYHQAWYNVGLAYMRSQNFAKAKIAFDRAIEYSPGYAQAWFSLGSMYAKQNKDQESISAYQKAIELKPNYRKAKLNLAVRYAMANQYAKAVEIYSDIIDKDNTYTPAWLNRGIAYFRQLQFERAQNDLTQALALDSESVSARQYLASIAIANKEYEKAIELLNDAVNRETENAQIRFELSVAYREFGDETKADIELQKARRLDPNNKHFFASK